MLILLATSSLFPEAHALGFDFSKLVHQELPIVRAFQMCRSIIQKFELLGPFLEQTVIFTRDLGQSRIRCCSLAACPGKELQAQSH